MVQPGAPVVTGLLGNLPQRPPTPPRESDQRPPTNLLTRWFSKSLGTQTPPDHSPQSSAESPNQTSAEKSGKKVEWATRTEYRYPPGAPGKEPGPFPQVLRPLPSSANQKPAKSILKPYNGMIAVDRSHGSTKLAPPHSYASFSVMLESIVQQLAGEDRHSRLDGYMTLSGVLKASDNIPDVDSLKNKMGLLMQFIQRDLAAKTINGTADTVLINNSLILLGSLLFKRSAFESLNNEFCSYIVDYALGIFEDSQGPKDVIRHLLFILANQNFSPKVMTIERVKRIMEALHIIDKQVKGKSIVLGRVAVFRKLFQQSSMSFILNVDWIEDVFSDMLSSLKDIRTPVVDFALDAAFEVGSETRPSRAFMDLFQLEKDGDKFGNYYSRRLSQMIRKKPDGTSVPQIWSVAILFLRSRPKQFDHWEFMTPWLQIIQECFNSSDHETKIQANLAWNRLVYATSLDEKTSPRLIKVLRNPLNSQLKRKPTTKSPKDFRQSTMGGICNLLYYTMKPNVSFTQLDLYWDECVVPFLTSLLTHDNQSTPGLVQEDLEQGCAILGALLDNSSGFQKVWKPDRAYWKTPIAPGELPSLDPKWIRKNYARVLDLLEPVIERCFWHLKDENNMVLPLWKSFMSSVALARAKEIKASHETMACLARILTTLNRLWLKGPTGMQSTGESSSTDFMIGFECLVTIVIGSLGVVAFTEKFLSITQQDTFTVVSTPSTLPTKQIGTAKSPLSHLISLILQPSSHVSFDENYFSMVEAIVTPFFQDRKSTWSRIDLVRDLATLITTQGPEMKAARIMWDVLSTFAQTAISGKEDGGSSSSGSHSLPLGANYRNIVHILEIGTIVSSNTPTEPWKSLFMAVSNHITAEAGDSGRAILVIEPLARALRTQSLQAEHRPKTSYCLLLIGNAEYPKDRQALDAAHRRLWGMVSNGQKTDTLDPYDYLYKYLNSCLTEFYSLFLTDSPSDNLDLLHEVEDLLRRCPKASIWHVLTSIQEGLAVWIGDPENKLGGRKISDFSVSVLNLWKEVCVLIKRLPNTDSETLDGLKVLISSGLGSRHKSIATSSVKLWNTTFGAQAKLDYPPQVQDALMRLRPVAILELPSFPEASNSEPDPSLRDLLESQDDLIVPEPARPGSRGRYRTPQLSLSPAPRNRSSVDIELPDQPSSSSLKRQSEFQLQSGKRKAAKGTPTPKLRHDDSQIQFTAIESSPLADAVQDSQLLTDRQREVKERQQMESASMFPDLRSSPLVRSSSALPQLTLSSGLLKAPEATEIPSTPIPLPEQTTLNEYITSSPTPRRDVIDVQLDSDAIEPPSSPPETSRQVVDMENAVQATAEDVQNTAMESWDMPSSPPNDVSVPPSEAQHLLPSVEVDDADVGHGADLLQPETELANHEAPQLGSSVEPGDGKINDTFVDALSSPGPLSSSAPQTPNDPQKMQDVYVDALTSPEEGKNSHRATRTRRSQRISSVAKEASPRRVTRSNSLQTLTSINEAIEGSSTNINENIILTRNKANTVELGRSIIGNQDSVPAPAAPETVELNPARDDTSRLSNISHTVENADGSVEEENGVVEGISAEADNKRKRVSARLQGTDSSQAIKRTKISSTGAMMDGTEVRDPVVTSSAAESPGQSEVSVSKGPGRRSKKPKARGKRGAKARAKPAQSLMVEAVEAMEGDESQATTAGSSLSQQASQAEPEQPESLDVGERSLEVSHEVDQKTDGADVIKGEIETSLISHTAPSDPDDAGTSAMEAVVVSDSYGKEEPPSAVPANETGLAAVMSHFQGFLDSLQAASLSREEADKVEYLLWDAKRELSGAELRGRRTTK